MKVCIVGHGASLLGAGKGHEIDSHVVVRLKQGWKQCIENPKDYGTRTDVLMTSAETLGCFDGSQIANIKQYWVYPKLGWYEEHLIESVEKTLGKQTDMYLNLINKINWRFKQVAKHPNVSLGMAALIYTRHFLSPKEIVLAGFDTLLNPEIEFDRNPNIPRTGAGPYPDHDWVEENKLLHQMKFNVKAL